MKTQRKKNPITPQSQMDSLAYDLRLALMTQQLQLVFQPKVCIQTNQVVGAEALLRWQHPVEGLISADRWVSLAESHNLMRPLTLWLLDKVVQLLESTNDAAIPLAINVSPNILDGSFAIHVLKTLSAAGIAPHLLEIEITESTPVVNMTNLANAVHLLQSRGVKIYLDDFGTGYSTMQYLVDVPVNGIKVDKRFVQQAPLLPAARLILRSLIELASEIGVTVVCEGVETMEQLNLVKRLGAHIIQGYISGKPMSSEALFQMVETPGTLSLPEAELGLYKVQAS